MLDEGSREVVDEQIINVLAVGQAGRQDGFLQRDLGVGQEDGNLRCRQAPLLLRPLDEPLVVRQELDAAMQRASGLEAADQTPMHVDQRRSCRGFERDGLRLLVVVDQDQAPNFVGHRSE